MDLGFDPRRKCWYNLFMNFTHLFTKEATFLADTLRASGINMRLVGGAVRDALLGVTPKDLDFAVDQPPERVTAVLEAADVHVIPTGLQHGTITAVVNGEPFELTTLRIDVETDGRHAEVQWTHNFEQDAGRRDFTVNAMSVDPEGNLFDYFGGQDDLEAGVIQFIGVADERIQEDFLRILRFFRFQQRLGSDTIDQHSIEAIRRGVAGLKKISGERIWMEMSKILTGKNPRDTLDLMEEVGVFDMIGIRHFRTSQLVREVAGRTGNAITILAAGCSDVISMMETKNTLETWWKVTAGERDLFNFIANNTSGRMMHPDSQFWNEELKRLSVQPKANDEFVRELAFFVGSDLFDHWDVPVFPVRGADLLDAGMHPGKEIGVWLNAMRFRWVESDFTLGKDDLLKQL